MRFVKLYKGCDIYYNAEQDRYETNCCGLRIWADNLKDMHDRIEHKLNEDYISANIEKLKEEQNDN